MFKLSFNSTALSENNIKFREQERVYKKGNPVPIYIIDFVAFGEFGKIAIECDGRYHTGIDQQRLDAQRDYYLIQQNHYYDDMLRFIGSEIKNNISSCIETIKTSIAKYDALKRTQKERSQIDVCLMRSKPIKYDESTEFINIIYREIKLVLK